MAQKWRVLRNTILVGPEKATTIVLAIMTLHNYLRSDVQYMSMESGIPELERSDVLPVSWQDLPRMVHGHHFSTDARAVREEFCIYFNNEGAVGW